MLKLLEDEKDVSYWKQNWNMHTMFRININWMSYLNKIKLTLYLLQLVSGFTRKSVEHDDQKLGTALAEF